MKNKKTIFLLIAFLFVALIGAISKWVFNSEPSPATAEQPKEIIFSAHGISFVQLTDKVTFAQISTLSYFVNLDEYYAENLRAYQQQLSSIHTIQNQLNANGVLYESKKNYARLKKPIKISYYENSSTVNITTGDARYNIDKKLLTSNQPMKIQSSQGVITAKKMKLDLDSQSIELLGRVNSIFKLDSTEK